MSVRRLRAVPWAAAGLALLARGPMPAQAPLTHSDSLILASQPTGVLIFEPSLLHRLEWLAAGLDREVVLCLGGSVHAVVCWWRRVQVVINRHVRYLPRFPRQWAEPSP